MGVCKQRDSWVDDLNMSVVFPNMDTQLGFWKTGETDCVSVPTDLSLFLAKYPDHRSVTPEPQKIRVVWPAIFSSDCSTWLSTRKAESDKKQTEKENTKPNPWLVTGEDQAATNLASSVREGLLQAGNMETDTKESRVPLPISEEVTDIAENDVKMEDEPQSLPAMVRMGLLRAGSVSLPPRTQPQDSKSSRPWAPKSLAEEVKIGLLKSVRGFDKEIDSDESIVSDAEVSEGTMESIADALRKSFMNISMNSETTTASLEKLPEESREESLDAWILDDGQSEGASIITLDTLTDSDDMEDFDDFKDIEDELSMWISKN